MKKFSSLKTFSPNDDLRLKLDENNQKINTTKVTFLFVASHIYILEAKAPSISWNKNKILMHIFK